MLHINEETARCLLCYNAPCGEKAARAIRAARFDNLWEAVRLFNALSEEELTRAENACIHYDRPVRIKDLAKAVTSQPLPDSEITENELPSLEINFCDMVCENPFFLASSAICTNYDMVARALEAGWAGVFYKTISKQTIREVSPRFDAVHKEGTPFVGFRNMEQLSENPYNVDFDILHRLKQNYPSKRIIASIMGQTEEEWIELAKMAEQAGCDAVELNFSCPQMRLTGLGSDIGQNPELILFYTSYVRDAVSIPVIPKMTPNITSMSSPALACFYAGAAGISAINTIKSITMSRDAEVLGKMADCNGRPAEPLRKAASPLAVLITAIGVSYFLQNSALLIFGSDPKMFTSVVPFQSVTIGSFSIPGTTIVSITVSIILVAALQTFINKTKPGQAMLACSQDRDAASLMGISVNGTITLTFAIGSAMAAIAGVLLCSAYPTLSPTTGAMPGIKAFVAAVFGGIGSIPGAMIGGLVLGVIEILSRAYISSQLSDAIVFSVLIIVLLVKPTGLFGKVIQEKV